MCAIAGVVYLYRDALHHDIEKMINDMKHRGPDDLGFFFDQKIALGQSRLAVIDIQGGKQPMLSSDGNLVLVFNGEIYNYKDLMFSLQEKGIVFKTQSDSEVLLHLYEQYGSQMMMMLNGMFSFAIYDKRNNEIFIARDRLGVKPLYIYQKNGLFAFASELQGLFSLSEIRSNLSLNHDALWHYFSLLYVPPPKTIFQEISVFPAGSYGYVRNGILELEAYWSPIILEPSSESASLDVYLDTARKLINTSVSLRMQSDVPYGAFLSGGVDSSLVVGAMATASHEPVKTFTARIQDEELDEVSYAAVVADKYKTEHHVLDVGTLDRAVLYKIVSHMGQPFADSSILPTYLIAQKIRQFVTVVLGGDGGDELFCGYNKYSKLLTNDSNATVEEAFINRVGEDQKNSIFSEEFKERITEKKTFSALLQHPWNKEYQGLDLLRFLDITYFLGGDILPKLDSLSMAHSLEAREPLLDNALVEFALSLPTSMLVSQHYNKVLLKALVAREFSDSHAYRQKVGFIIPVSRWLSELLKDGLPEPLFHDIFNQKKVNESLDRFIKGDQTETQLLFGYAMFAFWSEWFRSLEKS